jgi:enoyl-CoA hydratase/carnithine racemase
MEHVELTIDGAVAIVGLHHPPVNAMSAQVAHELGEAFRECEDPAIRAVVVTGQPHFAAGADIKGFKAALDAGDKDVTAQELLEAVGVLESLDKPTIAAVHGYALGGGCELALAADFRYLAEDARIGQPEILLGIIPGAGGTQRLQRVVGFQRAKELIYSGRHVEAAEALEIGLADKLAPAEGLLDLALADAVEWATKATVAIGAARRAMIGGRGLPLDQALALEHEQFQVTFASEDAVEGVDAFVEKRAADFNGS